MTPTCSSCKQPIAASDINVANDVAFCRLCNLAHKLSDLVHERELEQVDLGQAPHGTWNRSTGLGSMIGATHRSWGTALVTLGVALFWNGIVSIFVLFALSSTLQLSGVDVPDWFPAPKMNGKPMTVGMAIFLWLFLTPFIVIGVAMIGAFLSSLGGHTEVRIRANEGAVFTGFGSIGWSRRFKPELVKDVRLDTQETRDGDGGRMTKRRILIELENGKQIKFGSALREDRMKFVAAAVRQVLSPR